MRFVFPIHPDVRGVVALTARVDSDGTVRTASIVSGNRALAAAAVRSTARVPTLTTPVSLIAFAAWSSFAHAAVMAVLGFQIASERGDLLASAVLVVIGVALIVLAPAKPVERVSAAVA